MREQHIGSREMRDYQKHLRQEERAAATVEKYLRDIRAFSMWLNGRAVTKELAFAWKEKLLEDGRAPMTVNGKLSALNGILRFLGREDCQVRLLSIQRMAFRDSSRELTRSEYQRLLCAARDQGNERAALALDLFNYGVKKYIGAYAAAMGGVDAVIFTAGVGENDKAIRAMVCQGLDFMGLKLDGTANDVRGKETVISAADSKVKVLLIPTNEELMIAIDTAELAK